MISYCRVKSQAPHGSELYIGTGTSVVDLYVGLMINKQVGTNFCPNAYHKPRRRERG